MNVTSATSTRFAHLSPFRARFIFCGTLLLAVWLLASSLAPAPSSVHQDSGGVDLDLYRRISLRVHAGEGYYDAANQELRAFGYPTGSIFNWRTPFYAWLHGAMPAPVFGRLLLVALSLVTLSLAYRFLAAEGASAWASGLCLIFIAGNFLWSLDGDAFYCQELWAGALIAMSICAYAGGNWIMGVLTALIALFFRELALPYCLIACAMAYYQGRRRELCIWAAGLCLYVLFFCWHASQVTHQITPGDRLPATWLQFGGAGFLITTCQMNKLLFSAPAWVSAIFLLLSCMGLAGWRSRSGVIIGLTVAAYLIAFTMVGQAFNDYWGLIYTPLLPFGLIHSPRAIADLWASFRRQQVNGLPASEFTRRPPIFEARSPNSKVPSS